MRSRYSLPCRSYCRADMSGLGLRLLVMRGLRVFVFFGERFFRVWLSFMLWSYFALWFRVKCGLMKCALCTRNVASKGHSGKLGLKNHSSVVLRTSYISIWGFRWWWSRIWWSFARIVDRLIRNRLINYWFCHFLSDCGKKLAYGVFDDGDHEYDGVLPELLID